MIKFSFSTQSYQTGRIIGDHGDDSGPMMSFFGGIHGNEPSGVVALQKVFEHLESNQVKLKGRVLGLAGNLPALSASKRFISKDLNRIWDREFLRQFQSRASLNEAYDLESQPTEFQQQCELFEIIEPLLDREKDSVYFIDLHTTSSDSVPFIGINDQLNNRDFALKFPVPTVLGIEEYLHGPLLSYLNDFGHVAMAFEAGQHDDPQSALIHTSFIYLTMLQAGVIEAADIPDLDAHHQRLQQSGQQDKGIYEVILRKAITQDDLFSMNPGYRNFKPIHKGEALAEDRCGTILAPYKGRIFMPLYQQSGEDGFFIVRKVPMWALKLSSVLRKINFETALTWLPGVQRDPSQPHALIVNKKVARFLAVELFHLLGYRRKKDEGDVMIFSRREID